MPLTPFGPSRTKYWAGNWFKQLLYTQNTFKQPMQATVAVIVVVSRVTSLRGPVCLSPGGGAGGIGASNCGGHRQDTVDTMLDTGKIHSGLEDTRATSNRATS